ncbi:hypothetical protein QFC20_003203 [Naganishia adeliensis]|uniref:Uncharacterized protein n=1 Tax=Naganishia adeliensis TaxID=92952 RepID=A0ACC2WGX0_9TREE|nr:hypothetical protein QFC20_003203 [Naganishia adeliensis]
MSAAFTTDGTTAVRRNLPMDPAPAPRVSQRPLSDADARLKQHVYGPSSLSSSGPRRTGKHVGGRNEHWSEREMGIAKGEVRWIVGLTVLAVIVRCWKIWQPSSVVFDEVHFGGFARKYIKQTFFMDVHPPLAKLLITLAALVGRFDGDFDFKDIGKDYLEPHVPYVTMRLLPALLGVAVVPLAYLTLRTGFGTRRTTALLAGLLITFENGLITQFRLILLDSPLIFFTALTAYFWVRFANLDAATTTPGKLSPAFTREWWTYLLLTGLSLGAVVSCKWVGLFTIATVGVCTVAQLWTLLGDLRVTPRAWLRHFAARALCLIVVPVLFYMFMFQIHFWVLNRSGEGDGFMSSEFQHTLIGHGMEDTYADVAYGSTISIRHVNTQGGYLHSHAHSYPTGSMQQQITLYPHRDENNNWLVLNGSTESGPASFDWAQLPMHYIENGAKIRLEHIVTEKRLHSHEVRPPISEVEFQNEVSGYGFPGFAGDANDDFIVEITSETRGGKDKRKARERIRTLRSHFRLRHVMTGCYLFSHKVKLPEWGFEQQEVTCNKNPTWDNSLWYVETNTHPLLGLGSETVNYHKPGFLAKFLELQGVMWQTNQGLTDRHAYDSRPSAWPILRRGINFWVKDKKQVYLIGNPVIWWTSTLAVLAYLGLRTLLVLREKRGYRDLERPTVRVYDEICGFLVIGWAMHYLPFFLMQRQLFLHHYFPALYFAILCSCAVFDLFTRNLRQTRRIQIAAVYMIFVLYCFRKFSPLAYAGEWSKKECINAKYLPHWDFNCDGFPDSRDAYHPHKVAQPSSATSTAINAETTLAPLVPEPGRNVFDDLKEEPEQKTVAIAGAPREDEMPVSSSPDAAIETSSAGDEAGQDTRAPLGKDAGAAEATFADAVGGGAGWQGGAEDAPGVVIPREERQIESPSSEEDSATRVDLDDEQVDLVEQALRRAEEDLE